MYILQPKADHQGSKIPSTDFRWIGPYIIEKVLPNNNYVVRKIGTNKTQILHRTRLRQFTPRQPIPDTPVTPREWQPDPEVIIIHDDLYARAWECEYDKPIFDSERDNMVIPNPPEVTVRLEEAADEAKGTPGTTEEESSNILPHADEIDDGADTDRYMQPDADNSVEQIDPTPTNSRSSKYDLRHNPRPNCNDDYRYWIVSLPWFVSGATTDTKCGFWESATDHIRSPYTFTYKIQMPFLEQRSITSNSILVFFQIAEFQTPRSRTTHPVYPSMSPGRFRRHP